MLPNCGHAVYFNISKVIEIFILEVNMSGVFCYTRIINFVIKIFLVGISIIVFGNVRVGLRIVEPRSSCFNFSSGSNRNNDISFKPLDKA